MANTTYGTPYVTSSDYVTNYPTTSLALANQIDTILGPLSSAWTSYTPSWTNLTAGNGTVACAYVKVGRLVQVRIKFTLGSTSSVGTIPELSLPASFASAYTNITPVGKCVLYDLSADGVFYGMIIPSTGLSTARVFVDNVAGTYAIPGLVTSTAPFTWATGDRIEAMFRYEAAS